MNERVFPAYAGMSPSMRTSLPVPRRFPRLRGDEPMVDYKAVYANEFSPPTRG